MLVPRSKFGSSLYNVPLLLALRFFYHASPFEVAAQQVSHGSTERDRLEFAAQQIPASFAPAAAFELPPAMTGARQPEADAVSCYEKLSTVDWLAQVAASRARCAHQRLASLTWTKSLASPLSHEFVQFVIEDTRTGRRSRHLTHRHVDGGDSVLLGFDWTCGEEPSQHHSLPLPLLTLTFDDGPSVVDFARTLVDVTKRRPEYSLLREMCWWYAEAVFEGAYSRFGGSVKEWDFAHLRYSFIVRTNVIKREKLVRHAEEFQRMNVERMIY